MKKIYFDSLGNQYGNIYRNILGVISIAMVMIGGFNLFQIENVTINRILETGGFILLMIITSRMFWYRNYVFNNSDKGTILIRLNSFMGKSLRFDQIERSEIQETRLIIKMKRGEDVVFNIENILQDDVHKLFVMIRGKQNIKL